MVCAGDSCRGIWGTASTACLCALLMSSACESTRVVATGQDSRPARPDAAPAAETAPPPDLAVTTDASVEPPRCVIAYRHSEQDVCCCAQRFTTTIAEVAADPCVVEAPVEMIPEPEPGCPHGCIAACDCISPPPPSRVVAWKEGGCRFVGECTTDADCVLATDTRRCCSCPQVYPKSLVDGDECLVLGSPHGRPSPQPSCDPTCDWLCPEYGMCAEPEPFCDVTARLPMGEKICRPL